MDANKADFPIRFMASRLGVSTSGFYGWRHRQQSPSRRTCEDRQLTEMICEIWRQSRGTYGSPRVWAELRLGQDIRVGRKRVERLMRNAGIEGVYGAVTDATDAPMPCHRMIS
ncbi:MAG: IS3 family transposase [Actinomycetota bacterium]|nr:IS3 family transposase [Actinomycetota bacterium]